MMARVAFIATLVMSVAAQLTPSPPSPTPSAPTPSGPGSGGGPSPSSFSTVVPLPPTTTAGPSATPLLPTAATTASAELITVTVIADPTEAFETPSLEIVTITAMAEATQGPSSQQSSSSGGARTAAIVLGVLCGIQALVIAYLAYRAHALAKRNRRLAAVYPSAPAATDVSRPPVWPGYFSNSSEKFGVQ